MSGKNAAETAAAEIENSLAVLTGPAVAWALEDPETTFLGPCVCHLSGDWTRVGPTWFSPKVGYIVVGPGAARWNTNAGLAEMAVTGSPFRRHSIAVAMSHDVHICLPIAPGVLVGGDDNMPSVREVVRAVMSALPKAALIYGKRSKPCKATGTKE